MNRMNRLFQSNDATQRKTYGNLLSTKRTNHNPVDGSDPYVCSGSKQKNSDIE
jgi:hypothetical protein